MTGRDYNTSTELDAARFERFRSEPYVDPMRPSRAEADRDEYDLGGGAA